MNLLCDFMIYIVLALDAMTVQPIVRTARTNLSATSLEDAFQGLEHEYPSLTFDYNIIIGYIYEHFVDCSSLTRLA